jgi:hypothetical protein
VGVGVTTGVGGVVEMGAGLVTAGLGTGIATGAGGADEMGAGLIVSGLDAGDGERLG